jgi:hypothetical protein
MHTKSDWRSQIAHEHYVNHDMADFAQEFLRRNPDYQQDYADTIARIAQGHLPSGAPTRAHVFSRRVLPFPLALLPHQ